MTPLKIKIDSEEELMDTLREAVTILNNLRARTKIWADVYGSTAKYNKEVWEDRADKFLEKLSKK
jgi:hypothetical protein